MLAPLWGGVNAFLYVRAMSEVYFSVKLALVPLYGGRGEGNIEVFSTTLMDPTSSLRPLDIKPVVGYCHRCASRFGRQVTTEFHIHMPITVNGNKKHLQHHHNV